MDASLLPAVSVPGVGILVAGGQPAMASAGPLTTTAMPGDPPADFAVLLAGLLGTREPALGATQESGLTPSVEALADGASLIAGLLRTREPALGATQESGLTPSVETMADGGSLLAGLRGAREPAPGEMLEDDQAPAVEARMEDATLVPELTPVAPAAPEASLPTSAPLAQMVPPTPQPDRKSVV